MMISILRYILADIFKKQGSFKIGVATIFMVVSFTTVLKSVIDVAPIAFVKVAQDQASIFDFAIESSVSENFIDGDTLDTYDGLWLFDFNQTYGT